MSQPRSTGLRATRLRRASVVVTRGVSLAAVLLPDYRRRVLSLLLLRPDEALHGREIARRTGIPPGTVTRELNLLTEVGLLQRERRGNQQIYSANRICPVFEEVAGIVRKTTGLATVLAEALAPAIDRIRVAFVFGSMASGRAGVGSDIDVMLIGTIGFADAIELLHPAQAVLAREINPRVFAEQDFRKRVTESFLQDVLGKPRIFVIGGENDLAELARQVAGRIQGRPKRSHTHTRRRAAQPR